MSSEVGYASRNPNRKFVDPLAVTSNPSGRFKFKVV